MQRQPESGVLFFSIPFIPILIFILLEYFLANFLLEKSSVKTQGLLVTAFQFLFTIL